MERLLNPDPAIAIGPREPHIQLDSLSARIRINHNS